jgi:putative NIF3 family GTP cyclohydrolase 1 type 2
VAARDEIIAFCDELLDAQAFADYCPNGLQVPGGAEVEKVVTGVSAHLELLERARDAGAQMVLAHHGLFWDSQPRALSEPMAATTCRSTPTRRSATTRFCAPASASRLPASRSPRRAVARSG